MLKEFVAISPQDLPAPEFIGTVANQNLKDANVPDLVIVSPPAFREEAERLAELRRQHDGLRVQVVTPRQIYHEFSSGRQDVSAIRNYMKYLYDTDAAQLKYLLLFGKCSYDYKNYLPNNTNFVPTYESRNSLHPIFSYSSDDYYAFLEDSEGDLERKFRGRSYDGHRGRQVTRYLGRRSTNGGRQTDSLRDESYLRADAGATRWYWSLTTVIITSISAMRSNWPNCWIPYTLIIR